MGVCSDLDSHNAYSSIRWILSFNGSPQGNLRMSETEKPINEKLRLRRERKSEADKLKRKLIREEQEELKNRPKRQWMLVPL